MMCTHSSFLYLYRVRTYLFIGVHWRSAAHTLFLVSIGFSHGIAYSFTLNTQHTQITLCHVWWRFCRRQSQQRKTLPLPSHWSVVECPSPPSSGLWPSELATERTLPLLPKCSVMRAGSQLASLCGGRSTCSLSILHFISFCLVIAVSPSVSVHNSDSRACESLFETPNNF